MSTVFQDYFTDETPPRNLIGSWYAKQDGRVRAAFDAQIELLKSLPDKKWKKLKPIKPMERDCAGLWEVIINLKDHKPYRHIRPIGVWHPEERIFVFLGAFEKTGRTYEPPNPCGEAQKYKAQYESRRGTISDHI